MLRKITAILLAVLLTAALAACGDKDQDPTEVSTNPAIPTANAPGTGEKTPEDTALHSEPGSNQTESGISGSEASAPLQTVPDSQAQTEATAAFETEDVVIVTVDGSVSIDG